MKDYYEKTKVKQCALAYGTNCALWTSVSCSMSFVISFFLVDAYVVLGKLIDLTLHQRKSCFSMRKHLLVRLQVHVVFVTKLWE